MAKYANCKHGRNSAFCPYGCEAVEATKKPRHAAQARERKGEHGFHGGETKQDVIDDICLLLGVRRQQVSVGSSLPSEVFRTASERLGLPYHSMPDACERIVKRAGMTWNTAFDSRGTASGGGSTVTLDGIQAVRAALRSLLA
ncbi:hypothetical protein ACIO3S_05045 [Nocardioides sp. NPDC087217]|uniref:hypothetical protein n=1 Tax=Nocardioides sp. NPDC087217 TaxID=3364335 RepID=UPI003823BBA9